MSKFFVVKNRKKFDKIIFQSREKNGFYFNENGFEKQKSQYYFSKT